MLSNVAVLVMDGVAPFELGVLSEVFGVDRSDQGLPVTTSPSAARAPGRCDQRRLHGAPDARPRPAGRPPTSSGSRRWAPTSQVPPEVGRRAAPGRRPRRLGDQRLLGHLRAQAVRAAGRPALHDPLDVRRRARRALPVGAASTPTCSTCRTAGSSPAPAPRPASTPACTSCASSTAQGRQRRRPPHGRPAAPRGRPAAVRRGPGARRGAGQTLVPLLAWLVEHLDEPHTVESLAGPRAHVAADVRPPVPRRDRHDAVRLAHRAAAAARRAAARGDRPAGRGRRRAGRLRHRAVLRHHFGQHRHTTPQAFRRAFRREHELVG